MNVLILSSGSLFASVSGTSAAFTAMTANTLYAFTSTTACYIKQGTGAQTAAAAAGNIAVAAGQTVLIHSGNGVNLSVIQQSATGGATLALATIVR